MKRKKDKRITASSVSLKQFLIIFAAVLFTCSNYHIIYIRYLEIQPDKQDVFSGITLVLVTSFVGAFIIGMFKKIYFDKPVRRIAEAARKIAGGDFSIRIAPIRKDGKKDEIEVLIEDFNKMAEELSTIETLKTDFITNVSHEIKSPLSVIQSYAAAIQDDTLSFGERREYCKVIIDASKKLSQLVSNILKLSKLENQEIFLNSQQYSLSEQLRECVLSFEDTWEKKNIFLIGDDIDEVVVHYDRTLLELVWNNIISNAIKFSDDGGEIVISLKDENGVAVVTVKDSGCGMSEKTVSHIFDKFYQGDTSHSTDGNGLGLALVKKVIDVIGGEISAFSKLKEGSVFTVKLKI